MMRRVLGPLALALGSLLLLAVVGEVFLRLTWRELPWRVPKHTTAPDPDLPVLRTLNDVDHPNLRGVYAGLPFRTNSVGLRGPEYSPDPPDGVFRILVTGDSVTMGHGLEEEEAYPHLLEELLNERGSGRRVQVLNAGLTGANAEFAIGRLEHMIDVYHPHLVVYGFTVNDIEGANYQAIQSPEPAAELLKRYSRFEHSRWYLLRVLWPRWVSLREMMSPTLGSYPHELLHNYFENPKAWNDFLGALDHLARLARERDVCAHVLIHTHLIDLGGLGLLHLWRPIYERVERAALKRGLGVTQSLPEYRDRRPAELRIAAWDVHPNVEGQRLLARALLAGLEGLPDSCWKLERGATRAPSEAAKSPR